MTRSTFDAFCDVAFPLFSSVSRGTVPVRPFDFSHLAVSVLGSIWQRHSELPSDHLERFQWRSRSRRRTSRLFLQTLSPRCACIEQP
jgi:hypothetical protein